MKIFDQTYKKRKQKINVSQNLKLLTLMEKHILEMRYALEKGTDPKKLQEIGDYYGLTRERVRQIEKLALQKLNIE